MADFLDYEAVKKDMDDLPRATLEEIEAFDWPIEERFEKEDNKIGSMVAGIACFILILIFTFMRS